MITLILLIFWLYYVARSLWGSDGYPALAIAICYYLLVLIL